MTCVKTHAHTRRRARNSKDLHIIRKGEPHEVRRRGIARVTSLHVLPETDNIHPVFHVSQLKPYVSTSSPMTVTSPPPLYADKRGGVYEVEAILAKRRVGKSWQYLVKWKGYDETENTWEPLAHVRHLADDVAVAPVLS
jgi:hypothetical protein